MAALTPRGALAASEHTERRGRAIVAIALGCGGDGWLVPEAVARVLGCYGVTLAEWRQAVTSEEAAAAAAELGGMVALKAVGPQLVDKSELGAVQLSLRPQTVAAEARRMAATQAVAGLEVTGFLVQQMAAKGVEMIVGVVQDPVFGPVVACGAGGTAVELMKDLSVRLPPLTDADAERMLRGLAIFPLLDGYRGGSRVDMAALKGLLLHLPILEFRCCDQTTRLDETICMAALIQAICTKLLELRERNLGFRKYMPALIAENSWRAMRYGIDGNLIDFGKQGEVPMRDLATELLEFIDDVVDDLGSRKAVEHVNTILREGTSADRQLNAHREHGSLRAVVDRVCEETVAAFP